MRLYSCTAVYSPVKPMGDNSGNCNSQFPVIGGIVIPRELLKDYYAGKSPDALVVGKKNLALPNSFWEL